MADNTTLANKVAILADLWLNYGDDETFEDFIAYNDLGLPLAYALDNDIIVANEKTIGFIDETFALLLAGLEQEDTGFNTLNELLMLPEEE
jgi:hypothetical protein